MGFYVRKSIKAGPFRFNLSKSGLGVSAGIPGFRVGSGPRGSYVHMGRNGVYYRSSLGSPGRGRPAPVNRPQPAPSVLASDVVLQDIPSATVVELEASNRTELTTQINEAARRHRRWPWVLAVLIVLLAAAPVAAGVLAIPLLAAMLWLAQDDAARKRAVVFYDVNDAPARQFERLLEGFTPSTRATAAWQVVARGDVKTTYQWKVNAGASHLVNRVTLRRSLAGPPALATNVAIPSLEAGTAGLYLLPDRLLVRNGRQYADLDYSTVSASAAPTIFIENDRVPSDSPVVGYTWRFVNKSGGPDRRFNNNRRIPQVRYGELVIRSASGLHLVFQLSTETAAQSLATVLSGASGVREAAQI